jgi:hypothetical protein
MKKEPSIPQCQIKQIARPILRLIETHLQTLGFTPHIHFEMEGTCTLRENQKELDFNSINIFLKKNKVLAKLKPEYWKDQWEWESLFLGQLPTKTSDDLEYSLAYLPLILLCHGAQKVEVRPVSWALTQHKKITGSTAILDPNPSTMHIPNSIQLSISASQHDGSNALLYNNLGEILQDCLIRTTKGCSLFFCPEEESFQRLSLKRRFNLHTDLSSPEDISGGTKGSIAYYRKYGKHDQLLGITPRLYNSHGEIITYSSSWERNARIEHRIGSTSKNYKPHLTALYALINLCQAIDITRGIDSKSSLPKEENQLPTSLYSPEGAIALLQKDSWFFNKLHQQLCHIKPTQKAKGMVETLKSAIFSTTTFSGHEIQKHRKM